MQHDTWGQHDYAVRFDWGLSGALATAAERGAVVVIDILSFTTAVSVAVSRGTWAYPYSLHSDDAQAFARSVGAAIAVPRSHVNDTHPYSLSPHSIAAAPTVGRLVLPSPNGSAIAAGVSENLATATIFAASFRNVSGVARWLVANNFGTCEHPISIIAAGERWPDGSLRPAVEDLLGAGALLNALSHQRSVDSTAWSPEAATVLGAYVQTPDVAGRIRACASARELSAAGYEVDVDMALAVDSDIVVPQLVKGAFRDVLH